MILDVRVHDIRLSLPIVVVFLECEDNSTVLTVIERASAKRLHHFPPWLYCLKWCFECLNYIFVTGAAPK